MVHAFSFRDNSSSEGRGTLSADCRSTGSSEEWRVSEKNFRDFISQPPCFRCSSTVIWEMSSVGAAPRTPYYCHQCRSTMFPQTTDMTCSLCGSDFIEETPTPPAQPSMMPASPGLPTGMPFPFGVFPFPSMPIPFGGGGLQQGLGGASENVAGMSPLTGYDRKLLIS